jgi:hypothetical protein
VFVVFVVFVVVPRFFACRVLAQVVGAARIFSEPTDVNGSIVDAGTIVVASIYGCHHNPLVWEDPEAFQPNRFDTDSPKYTEQVRWCLGLLYFSGAWGCSFRQRAYTFLFCFCCSMVASACQSSHCIRSHQLLRGVSSAASLYIPPDSGSLHANTLCTHHLTVSPTRTHSHGSFLRRAHATASGKSMERCRSR